MYELVPEIKNMHIVQLPQRQNDDTSQEMWYHKVLLLKEKWGRNLVLPSSTKPSSSH